MSPLLTHTLAQRMPHFSLRRHLQVHANIKFLSPKSEIQKKTFMLLVYYNNAPLRMGRPGPRVDDRTTLWIIAKETR